VTYRQNGMALTLNGSMSSGGGAILLDPPTDIIYDPRLQHHLGRWKHNLLATGNIPACCFECGHDRCGEYQHYRWSDYFWIGGRRVERYGASLTASAVNGARFTHGVTTATVTSVTGVVAVTNAVTGQ